LEIADFRARQRRMWEAGDYRPVGRLIEPAARTLVERAGVLPGHRVLDVATGSGSVAVAAAETGAEVVGVDITDAWFPEARRRAAAAGVHIDLLLGDAEELPVDDASFDLVLSSFGAIFAPRHQLVAAEVVRVCRPGGTIGLTAWTPNGANDAVFSSLTAFLPPQPGFVSPSTAWGDPSHVERLFAPHDVELHLDRPAFGVSFASPDEYLRFAGTNSGGYRAARGILEAEGRWEQAEAAVRQALADTNESEDATYTATWEYLLILARRAGDARAADPDLSYAAQVSGPVRDADTAE